MASPPTITANAAAQTANAVLKDYSSPELKVLGGVMDQTASATFRGPHAPTREDGVLRGTTSGWSVAFTHEGSQFEVWMFGPNAGAGFRVWVNEQPHSATWFTGASSGARFCLVDFTAVGGRARRRIVLESTNIGNPFLLGGIQIAPTDVIAAPTGLSPIRCIVLGDSYALGQTGPANPEFAYPWQFGRLLGINDIWANAAAGTGVISNNGGGALGAKYIDRLALDVYPYSPDILIIQGSTNDNASTAAAVQAAATTLIRAVQANLPNTVIIVTGVLFPGTFTAGYTNVSAGMQAAALACNVTFVDTITPAIWSNGTGKAGNLRAPVTDAVLSSTTTITSATAAFLTATDVGKVVIATGIPTGTKIASVTNATTAVLSAAATVSTSGVTLAITNQTGDGAADTYLSSDGLHPSSLGHANIAGRLASAVATVTGIPVG